MDSPYKIFGVDPKATDEEIRKAYRKLAKKYHPDLNQGRSDAEKRFKEISAAYALLSEPEKRARFDRGEIDANGNETPFGAGFTGGFGGFRGGRAQAGSGPFSGGRAAHGIDLGDILEGVFSSFGGGGAAGHGGFGPDVDPGRLRGEDRRYSVEIDFATAANGGVRRLTLGDGRSLDVAIPAGIEDGTVLRLKGQGGGGWSGAPAGDALIEVKVAPHLFFRRVGDDIHLDVPVTIEEAVLGARIKVPTLSKSVMLNVPAESDGGTVLRLKGKGIHRKGAAPGDQIVTLRLVLGGKPDPDLVALLEKRVGRSSVDPRRHLFA